MTADVDYDAVQTKLASIALAVAAVAFFIALAQVLQQYLTSSYREKCMSGAIGSWSRYTRTRWNVFSWRLHVQYPVLNLSAETIIDSDALNKKNKYTLDYFYWKHLTPRERARFVPMTLPTAKKEFPEETIEARWYKIMMYLAARDELFVTDHKRGDARLATIKDLCWRSKIKWVWFLITGPGFSTSMRKSRVKSARAGWANLLRVFSNFEDPDHMMIESYSPADIIPDQIDVPIQTIELYHLILLCFVANLRKMDVNLDTGDIQAENEYVRIATQDVPAVGKVVTVDGDFESLHSIISKANRYSLLANLKTARGDLIFCNLVVEQHQVDPTFLLVALRHDWQPDTIDENCYYHRRINLNSGSLNNPRFSLGHQATLFRDQFNSSTMTWSKFWMDKICSSTPTYLMIMAFIDSMNIWSSRPLEQFLTPYSGHLLRNRLAWFRPEGANSGVKNTRPYASLIIDSHLVDFSTKIVRSTSSYLLPTVTYHNESSTGGRTWIANYNLAYLSVMNNDVAAEVSDPLKPLPLPTQVLKILTGQETIESAKEFLRKLGIDFSQEMYSLEAAVYLSLCIVDSRLQAEWISLEPDPTDHIVCSHQRLANLDEEGLGAESSDEDHHMIASELADLLSLWLEICRRIDCTSTPKEIHAVLDSIVADWQNDSTLCVDKLPSDHPLADELKEDLDNGEIQVPPKTRAELCTWLSEKDRLEKTKRMMTTIQLRVFLIHLSYFCHADSSIALQAKARPAVKLRMI